MTLGGIELAITATNAIAELVGLVEDKHLEAILGYRIEIQSRGKSSGVVLRVNILDRNSDATIFLASGFTSELPFCPRMPIYVSGNNEGVDPVSAALPRILTRSLRGRKAVPDTQSSSD